MKTKTEPLTKSSPSLAISIAVMLAYADCNRSGDTGMKVRNLNFKAPGAVTVNEAVDIMCQALGVKETTLGYNEFSPSKLRFLPEGTEVTLAREGSVCAYVKFPGACRTISDQIELELIKAMACDEFSLKEDGTYRIWWD